MGIYPFFHNFGVIGFFTDFFSDSNENILGRINLMSPIDLWNCNAKQIVYGNSCFFTNNYLSLAMVIGIFIFLIVVCKLCILVRPHLASYFKIGHKIFYNHINNWFWLFFSSVWFVSSNEFQF
jgi:hypothetical protein